MNIARHIFPRPLLLTGLAVFLLACTAGCGAVGNIMGQQGNNEVRATVDEIARDYIVADRVRYALTRNTSFGRYSRPSDLSIGDEIVIEFEETRGRVRRAVRIERADDRYDDDRY
jgi:hypothetical protein